jgi:hypothetical protein
MSTNKLVPIPIEVTVGEDTFQILPFGFKTQTIMSAKLGVALMAAGIKEGDTLDFQTLVDVAGDVLFWAAGLAIGKPQSYFDKLADDDYEQGLDILEAVYTANFDIFTKKVMPAVKARIQKLAAKQAGAELSPLMTSLVGSLPTA